MSLVKEARLRRVGRYYSLQLNAKCEKFEGNIVRIFGVVFSVEDKNVLCNRQMDRASKSSLPDLLPKSTGCVGLGMQGGC